MTVSRRCFGFIVIIGAGVAGYLIASAIFGIVAIGVLHTENDAAGQAYLEGTLGFSFSALAALISAYLVSRMLNFRNPLKRAGN